MLIVCTRDQNVIAPALQVLGWGAVRVVPTTTPILSQAAATTALQGFIALVGPAEDICFSAHGNDTDIGGHGAPNSQGHITDPWGWTAAEIAGMLDALIQQNGWHGHALFHVCCESVANFSAGVAVELGNLGRGGIACYGYNRSLPTSEGVPQTNQLEQNISLQKTLSSTTQRPTRANP